MLGHDGHSPPGPMGFGIPPSTPEGRPRMPEDPSRVPPSGTAPRDRPPKGRIPPPPPGWTPGAGGGARSRPPHVRRAPLGCLPRFPRRGRPYRGGQRPTAHHGGPRVTARGPPRGKASAEGPFKGTPSREDESASALGGGPRRREGDHGRRTPPTPFLTPPPSTPSRAARAMGHGGPKPPSNGAGGACHEGSAGARSSPPRPQDVEGGEGAPDPHFSAPTRLRAAPFDPLGSAAPPKARRPQRASRRTRGGGVEASKSPAPPSRPDGLEGVGGGRGVRDVRGPRAPTGPSGGSAWPCQGGGRRPSRGPAGVGFTGPSGVGRRPPLANGARRAPGAVPQAPSRGARGRGRTPGRVRDRDGKPASRAERPGSLYGRQGSPHRAKRPDPPEEGSSWGGRRGYGAFAPPLAGPPRPPHGPRGARPVPSPDTPGTPKGPRRPRGGPGHAASRPPRAGAFLEPPRRRLRAPPGGRDLRHAGGPRKAPPGGRTGQTGGGGLADAPHGPQGAPGDGGEGIGGAPSPVRRPRRGSPGGDPTARGRRGGGACFGRIPRPRAWGGARRRLSLGFRETCEGSRRRASPPFLHAVRTEEARVARTRAPRTFGGRRHARPPGSSRLVPRGLGQAGLRRGDRSMRTWWTDERPCAAAGHASSRRPPEASGSARLRGPIPRSHGRAPRPEGP